MNDKGLNRIAYIVNPLPWVDGADVTMKDITMTGVIPLQCEVINNVLHSMVERFKLWKPKNREADKFILDMMENYDANS